MAGRAQRLTIGLHFVGSHAWRAGLKGSPIGLHFEESHAWRAGLKGSPFGLHFVGSHAWRAGLKGSPIGLHFVGSHVGILRDSQIVGSPHTCGPGARAPLPSPLHLALRLLGVQPQIWGQGF